MQALYFITGIVVIVWLVAKLFKKWGFLEGDEELLRNHRNKKK